MQAVKTDIGIESIDFTPSERPFCHRSINPTMVFGHTTKVGLEIFTLCPSPECGKSFISYYKKDGSEIYKYLDKVSQGNIARVEFSKEITDISSQFVNIYNQAFSAEQMGLADICGMGYRKALEFLIKDFLCKKNTSDVSNIKKDFLGNCIQKYVEKQKIKLAAERAVWLGNDETHYERKWITKDLNDLKRLIQLTIHWIEMEILSEGLESDMPKT